MGINFTGGLRHTTTGHLNIREGIIQTRGIQFCSTITADGKRIGGQQREAKRDWVSWYIAFLGALMVLHAALLKLTT